MKDLSSKNHPKIELTKFVVSTDDFVEIVKRCSSNSNRVSLEIGYILSEDRWLLEGIDEIEQHKALISTPLKLTIDELTN